MKGTTHNIFMLLILLSIPVSLQAQDAAYEVANIVLQVEDASNAIVHNSETYPYEKTGVILANSITSKSGKDFFNFFTKINQLNEIIYSSDVTISEKYRNGDYTEISVHFENRLIYSFRVLKKKNYLYAAAQESVIRLKEFYVNSNGRI